MANIKNKVKGFWEDHKEEILVTGVSFAVLIGVGVGASKLYAGGFNYGQAVGFNNAIKWLDDTFPDESKACELWEAYQQNNPENILKFNIFGHKVK